MALQQQHEAMDAEEPPNQEQGHRGGLLWGRGRVRGRGLSGH